MASDMLQTLLAFLPFAILSDPVSGSLADLKLSFAKTFAMIFLMLGPFKVLIPFTTLTASLPRGDQVRMASVSVTIAGIMLLTAGLIGRHMIDNFDISVPVLALTGGLILFLMALRTVLPDASPGVTGVMPPSSFQRSVAINPIAFPTIVTPYGLAALIVFIALSHGNSEVTLAIILMVIATLAVDWVAMIYAGPILRHIGTALQIIAVVLGIVQTALGLQVIVRSLVLLGVIQGPA
jgi:multiple antibiotic resistance protein